jgi:hypothetical protein
MQRLGVPPEQQDIIIKASEILGVFRAPLVVSLGRGWYSRFLVRNPLITMRTAQILSKQCGAVSKETIINYFNRLLQVVVEHDVGPADTFNMDETSFANKGRSRKVLALRGSCNVWKQEPAAAYHLTIVVAVSATGEAAPPCFILPAASVETSVLDACPVPGALVTNAPKAFMNGLLFEAWLHSFGAWKLAKRGDRICVLILDNCSSHTTVKSVEIATSYGIEMVFLPPNATHILQPLDVAVFRGFKAGISALLSKHLLMTMETSVPRSVALSITGRAFLDGIVGKQKSSGNGFRTCGICPLSLPVMLAKLQKVADNGVKNPELGREEWLKRRDVVRDEILSLPPALKPHERKRVKTNSSLYDKDALAAHSVAKRRKKK